MSTQEDPFTRLADWLNNPGSNIPPGGPGDRDRPSQARALAGRLLMMAKELNWHFTPASAPAHGPPPVRPASPDVEGAVERLHLLAAALRGWAARNDPGHDPEDTGDWRAVQDDAGETGDWEAVPD